MKIWTKEKSGNASEENEDAANFQAPIYAVADGASEAYFSRVWAEELVKALIKSASDRYWSEPVEEFWLAVSFASAEWQEQVPLQNLPWYADYKAWQGSGAAVALLVLDVAHSRWRGIAIGDAVIVQVRKGQFIVAWPLSNSSEFNNSPILVGTKETDDRADVPYYDGEVQPRDHFFLMTDALAAWSLRCAEEGHAVWKELAAIDTTEAWEDFVTYARANGMRNDDITIIQLEVEDHDPSIPTT